MSDSLPSADPVISSLEAYELMRLSDALDAIPDDAFVRSPAPGVHDTRVSHQLALDVLETESVFEVHASVPGIDALALDITVLGESVRIVGEGRAADSPFVTDESDYRWLVRERPVGRFDRTVSFPSPVDPLRADATVRDGVLVVTLPKARRSAATRIPVRAGIMPSGGAFETEPVIDLPAEA
ncbi:MAG: Hsp20/alpha crystallin family protein [Thermomicrobiales bacterium]